jgi:hypothetical protein
MSDKRKRSGRKRQSRLVKAIPGASCRFCVDWLLANIGKTKGPGARVGQIARVRFTLLLDDCVVRLLQLGLCEGDGSAKRWAGEVLAHVLVSLRKHHNKLSRVNRAYQEMEKELNGIRPDVLVPSSPVGLFLQPELRTSVRHYNNLQRLRQQLKRQPRLWVVTVDRAAFEERKRNELVLHLLAASNGWVYGKGKGRPKVHLFSDDGIKAIQREARKAMPSSIFRDEIAEKRRSTWEDMAREWKIPEAYWPLKDFPPLSDGTEKQWWDFIWSRLKEQQAEILPLLRESGKGRAKAKNGELYLKDFYKQFRKHWLTLVREREAGTF